jgi:hypothetical protein
VARFSDRKRLTVGVQARVDLQHEFLEMRPPLALARHGGKEQVHQEGFAAPDPAMNVQARRTVLFAAMGGQPAEGAFLRSVSRYREAVEHPVERARQFALRRILRNRCPRYKFAVGLADGFWLPHAAMMTEEALAYAGGNSAWDQREKTTGLPLFVLPW